MHSYKHTNNAHTQLIAKDGGTTGTSSSSTTTAARLQDEDPISSTSASTSDGSARLLRDLYALALAPAASAGARPRVLYCTVRVRAWVRACVRAFVRLCECLCVRGSSIPITTTTTTITIINRW